jgi:hypothetical protein
MTVFTDFERFFLLHIDNEPGSFIIRINAKVKIFIFFQFLSTDSC